MLALNVNTVWGAFGSSVSTVTVFTWRPLRSPILNVAVISPFSPGATSFFANAAVVQPQEGFTALMCTGVSPLFWYLNTASTFEAPSSGFRSSSVFSKTKAACDEATAKKQSALENKSRLAFIGESKRENARGVNVLAEHTPPACARSGDSLRSKNQNSGQTVRWAHRLKVYVPIAD